MIEAENLCKNYGSFEAVKDVSFSAASSGILGLLGPNGAGKTTILKILAGYHAPDSGSLKIGGLSMEKNAREIKTITGYLPENNPLYTDISPLEYLNFAAEARLLQKEKKRNAINTVIENCGLESCANKKIAALSKGLRQRTGLAAALLHDPPLLILDEPGSGLDPNQIVEIRSLIRELGKRKTVIFSTHILREAEALCSKVIVIDKGRVAAQGPVQDIAGKNGSGVSWELTVKGGTPEKIRASLESKNLNVHSLSVPPNGETGGGDIFYIKVSFPETEKDTAQSGAERIFDWALKENLKILEMNKAKSNLEDIFVRLTGAANNNDGQAKGS